MRSIRYLLLQIRNPGDPMASQEVRCFAKALDCDASMIRVIDLLGAAPAAEALRQVDMVLLGGSGHYSIASRSSDPDEPVRPSSTWIERALDTLREIHTISKPTFASCWGFQAMARALGGECINEVSNAELGTIELQLTTNGRTDPVFGMLPGVFYAQAGHEDRVCRLPLDAELLASSGRVQEQAFRFKGKPIYCTQFHPEMDQKALIERIIAYPEYIERIARMPFDDFLGKVRETPEANSLLRIFLRVVFG